MPGGGNQEEGLGDAVKEKRGCQQAAHRENGAREGAERTAARAGLPRLLAQTDGAQKAVVVLGHAFATEEMPALRALDGGFARGMIEAMLLGQGRHGA